MQHELKTDKPWFEDVCAGRKTFEIRFDDREFAVGDTLHLRETLYKGREMRAEGKPLFYTGRSAVVEVIGIMRGPIYGLYEGWVILSLGGVVEMPVSNVERSNDT